ncbi:MAG: helix-turn-helix domain-containing protein [Pirellulaceae bacterium]
MRILAWEHLTVPCVRLYHYDNSVRDARLFVRIIAMIPAEELSKMAPRANAKSQESASAAPEGRVDKPILDDAANPCPASACARQGSEYFNKQPPISKPQSRGQPPRLDQRLQAVVVLWVSRGLSCRAAARHAGINHSTISRAAQRDPAFAAALKEAKRFGKLRPRPGIRGWRQAAAVLEAAGFDPGWTKEEKQLLNGTFPGSINWSAIPWPHDTRPQE